MKIFDFISQNFGSNSIVFEIGIHRGEDTRKIYESTKSQIHAFEADPRNIDFLEKNSICEICKFNPCAVSDRTGLSNFFLSSGNPFGKNSEENNWSLSSSLKNPKDHLKLHPWCKFETSSEVSTISIDDYVEMEKIKFIDFMWMDVQGAEDLVFAGMKISKKITKYIYTEYCEDGIELYESAPTKAEILEMLGPDWEILYDFGNTGSGIDVLLKNKNI